MLESGKTLGPYEVLAPLGAGGMGEVYRAKDTRLGREVAIKVLPQHLSDNADIRTRFEREAKTISALNHPNICTLFDVGREGDIDYLVMELVEGDTLAARLTRGALPTPELLRIGAQIADALDRAHRAGVVHRDLKPGNIMLTRSGAKLMDFGLARATAAGGPVSASGVTMAALTQTAPGASPLTAEGTLVGTFQYMAPEQLEGGEADARSDIWALGCVLYEMATGRRAFDGRSQASLIAAILEREPAPVADSTASATSTASGVVGSAPHGLDRLIRACLAKDPDERLQTAHDVKLQLQWIAEAVGMTSVGTPASASLPLPVVSKRAPAKLPWGIAALMAVAAVAAVALLWPAAHAPKPAYRFSIDGPVGASGFSWPRVSPDGRSLVFLTADSAGTRHAWLRPLDQAMSRPIAGADGLTRAYWSPDSREIAFAANGKVMRLAVTGGTPVIVCDAPGGADISWGSHGSILLDGSATDSIRVVPAAGGELKPATRIDHAAHEVGAAWPCFLPDGEHFLFLGVTSGTTGGNIRLGKLGSLDSKLLGTSDGRVEYAPGGWLLFVRGTALLAQKLDIGAGKLTGQPLTLVENLRVGSTAGHYSISRSGVFAFFQGTASASSMLQEYDRAGHTVGAPITQGAIGNPELSPDGRSLLFQRVPGTGGGIDADIWVRDLVRGTETKLTFGVAGHEPMWSPDGKRFACIVANTAGARLLIGSADGLGARDSIPLPNMGTPTLTQWSVATGRLLIVPQDFHGVLSAAPGGGDKTLQRIVGPEVLLAHAALSPDGRWLAYATNQGGGAVQVYVQSMTGTPGRWQISTAGGSVPRWTRGGRELIYESAGASLMAVDIDAANGFHVGTPHQIMTLPSGSPTFDQHGWCCSADGTRFFGLLPPKTQEQGNMQIVTDFQTLVNRK